MAKEFVSVRPVVLSARDAMGVRPTSPKCACRKATQRSCESLPFWIPKRPLPPAQAAEKIAGTGRSPLTVAEGLAVLAGDPGVLRSRNCFSLLGSRAGDKRVPALWVSARRPRLGWCYQGAPHSWLGTASCAARVTGGPALAGSPG